ncbi:hypothetical protein PS1_024393 [Malus domestica]
MAPPIPFDQKPSEPNFHGALFSNLPIFWHILIHLIKELHKDSLNFSVSSSLSIKPCSGNNIHLINKDDGRSILLGKTENITNQGLDREEEDDDELKLEDYVSDGEPSDQKVGLHDFSVNESGVGDARTNDCSRAHKQAGELGSVVGIVLRRVVAVHSGKGGDDLDGSLDASHDSEMKTRCIGNLRSDRSLVPVQKARSLPFSIRGGSHGLSDCDVQRGSKLSMGL